MNIDHAVGFDLGRYEVFYGDSNDRLGIEGPEGAAMTVLTEQAIAQAAPDADAQAEIWVDAVRRARNDYDNGPEGPEWAARRLEFLGEILETAADLLTRGAGLTKDSPSQAGLHFLRCVMPTILTRAEKDIEDSDCLVGVIETMMTR